MKVVENETAFHTGANVCQGPSRASTFSAIACIALSPSITRSVPRGYGILNVAVCEPIGHAPISSRAAGITGAWVHESQVTVAGTSSQDNEAGTSSHRP